MKTALHWQVGFCESADSRPEELFPATVPGAVQLDYARQYGLPDVNFELNFKQYQWMQERFWVYTAEYDAGGCNPSDHLLFRCKGIDYRYDIYANGTLCCSGEGMYRPVCCDLSRFIGQRITLEIVIYPAPRSDLDGVRAGTRDEANQSCKPAVSYGWDFHPRLIPLGIWDEAYIEVTDFAEPLRPSVCYELDARRSHARVNFTVNCDRIEQWRFTDPAGAVIFEGTDPTGYFEIENPALWWCNGFGEANLYGWSLTVKNRGESQTFCGKIGFRTVSLEMNEGTWTEIADTFPKTRSCPPITLCLNGVKIFAKGTNWVAPEIFYGTIGYDRYREQLELIKAAHLNIVRCWGGAIVNKDSFFEICDELGILVWQEFPLGCNNYESTKSYLSLLRQEATDIIERVKDHPCLAIWCGGNELFNSWSGMTDQSKALRLLNSLTLEKTPDIPFLPTSPLMGMAHGSYIFEYFDGREVIEVMSSAHHTAYTEFGIPALSNADCLAMAAPPEKLFPLEENELTRAHHAFHAWAGETWACPGTVRKYYGESSSLEELVRHSQQLQCVGYRFIFEEARRQKPYCSMAINWCFNEPWACLANNSVVCYPNSVKPAYYEIAAACRSVAASAKYKKFSYRSGEMLEFDLWLLNDSPEQVPDGRMSAFVQIGGEEPVHLLDWDFSGVAINTNLAGPTARFRLPEVPGAREMKIILSCGEYSAEYPLRYSCPVSNRPKEKMLNI